MYIPRTWGEDGGEEPLIAQVTNLRVNCHHIPLMTFYNLEISISVLHGIWRWKRLSNLPNIVMAPDTAGHGRLFGADLMADNCQAM